MTGQLRGRYQDFRRLGVPATLALEFARESLVHYPGSGQFISALLEFERMLRLHFGFDVSRKRMRDEFGYNIRAEEEPEST